MDTDVILTLGLALLVLSLPALVAAWVEGRLSRFGTGMLAVAAGMIGWAHYANPAGYRLENIPDVVLGVVARILN